MTLDWSIVGLSLRVALTATLVVVLVGVPLGYLLARKSFRGRSLLQNISTLPLVLPPTVVGYYLLSTVAPRRPVGRFWSALSGGGWLVGNFKGIVIAAAVVALPLCARASQGAVEAVDRRLEDAAALMGLPNWKLIGLIALPLAKRGILAGVAMAFARALGDFGTTLMVGGSNTGITITLPIEVMRAFQRNEYERVRNLSLVLTAVGFSVLFVIAILEKAKT